MALEACSSAQWRVRTIVAPANEVVLLHAKFIRPFVQINKTDAADAPYLTDDVAVAEYVTAVFETGDPDLLLPALDDVAQARALAQIAKEVNLGP